MSFFSALYMLWNVLIVNISCSIVITIPKKKKKKKQTRTSVLVKMPKAMPQIPHYLSFLLGKGGNSYTSNPIKSYKKLQVHFLTNNPPPPAHTKLDKASMTHFKIDQST